MTGSGFVGVNPIELVGVAETVEQYAARIQAAGRAVDSVLHNHPGLCVDFLSMVSGLGWALDSEAAELRWRAAAIEAAQKVETFPALGQGGLVADRAEFAAVAVFDLGNWERAYRAWRAFPDRVALRAMDPASVSSLFSRISPQLASAVAYRYPEVIGGLDGAPANLRYLANQLLIADAIEALEAQIADLEARSGESSMSWLEGRVLLNWYSTPALTNRLVEHLRGQIAEYEQWLEEGRQIILFDPGGDGRVAEVFGNLDRAAHIAVVIPGMSNALGNFSEPGGGFRANSAQLHAAGQVLGGPDVATIAWLGYDSPDNVGALAAGAARIGAPALVRFLDGIDPEARKQITVVAHSYGSVLAGSAAAGGISADNLVFVGSPGTTLDHSDDAVLRSGGRVWAALAEGDPIGAGVSAKGLMPPPWLPLEFAPTWILIDLLDNGAEDLWHGTNPVADEFGATRIATDGSSGHSEYFENGSLVNLLRITQGLYTEVDPAE